MNSNKFITLKSDHPKPHIQIAEHSFFDHGRKTKTCSVRIPTNEAETIETQTDKCNEMNIAQKYS